MDYARGGELFDYLDSQKEILGEKAIRNIMMPLFEGIEYIHQIGLIHRDLKPQNILIRNKECLDLLISDFGFSTISNSESDQNRCGTVGFLAPELIIGQHYDEKVDIFSLGVILYILYTGSLPFDDIDSEKSLQKNKQGIIDYNIFKYKGISDYGINFLKECLHSDPKQRMSAKQALSHPWFSLKNIISSFGIQFIDQIKQNDGEQIESKSFIEDDDSILPIEMIRLYCSDIQITNNEKSP